MPIGSIDLPRALLVVVTPYLLWFRFHLDGGGHQLQSSRACSVVDR